MLLPFFHILPRGRIALDDTILPTMFHHCLPEDHPTSTSILLQRESHRWQEKGFRLLEARFLVPDNVQSLSTESSVVGREDSVERWVLKYSNKIFNSRFCSRKLSVLSFPVLLVPVVVVVSREEDSCSSDGRSDHTTTEEEGL
jgi:hypothetical protein